MVNLLRRLFIKNYRDVKDEKVRAAHGKLGAWFGIFSNAILFLAKFISGLLSKSVSVVSDSINNLSDFANSSITLVGFKISSKPADKKHPFGHQRMEYITGLIVSIVIIALAIIMGYQSIDKIIAFHSGSGDIEVLSPIIAITTFVVLGVAIFFKLAQAYVNFSLAKIIDSVALKATGVDSLTDAVATTLLLISSLLSYYLGYVFLDGYMGLIISLFICYSGIKMVIATSSPLLGESVDKKHIQNIIDEILSYEGVLGIHDILAHNYGPTKLFMSVHVEIDARMKLLSAHELIDNIEMDIRQKFDVELTIHMDPIDVSNEETLKLKEQVISILKDIDKSLSIHDFRVVHGEGHTNILFDILVPFKDDVKQDDILQTLSVKMNDDEKKTYHFIVNFDHPFIS